MGYIKLHSAHYDAPGMLDLTLEASNGLYSGYANLIVESWHLAKFAAQLAGFPASLADQVRLELGDESGEFPYYIFLCAQNGSAVNEFGIFMKLRSMCGFRENAYAEFFILAEPSSINELGNAIIDWLELPDEILLWSPRF